MSLLTLFPLPIKVHFHLSGNFDLGFLQIPHWPVPPIILDLQWSIQVSSDTLALWSTYSLLSGL
jgi:hypothetical protein